MDLNPPACSCACTLLDDAALTIFQNNSSSNFPNSSQPTDEDRVINVSLHESGDASVLSSSEQAAAARLQTFEDMPFLDRFPRLRAHGPNGRHSSPAGGPLVLHPNTWSTPRNFPKEAMCQTLSATRPESTSRLQISRRDTDHGLPIATAKSTQMVWQAPSPPITGLTTTSTGLHPSYASADASEFSLQTMLDHTSSFFEPPRATSRCEGAAHAVVTGHMHWCTICEKPTPIESCGGWKRHEREQHERVYICMPKGPVAMHDSTLRCAFCGLAKPSQKHLDTHNARLCAYKPSKTRRYARKQNFVKHLENHHVLKASASAIVDQWRVSFTKKFYACGFCISIFTTNRDRLHHIDSHHYKQFQHIRDWDQNQVIKGLLLQSGVYSAWTKITIWDTRSAELTWDIHVIATLQLRLELSEEPAHQLASDALSQSSLSATRITQTMPFTFAGSLGQHRINCQDVASKQQYHPIDDTSISRTSFGRQNLLETGLHPQAGNFPWPAANSNANNAVSTDAHTLQAFHGFHGNGTTTSHSAGATTGPEWRPGDFIDESFSFPIAQVSSNIGASSLCQMDKISDQSEPTTFHSGQGNSLYRTNSSDRYEDRAQSYHDIAGISPSHWIGRPGPSYPNQNSSSKTFQHGQDNDNFREATMHGRLNGRPQVANRPSRTRVDTDVEDVMLDM